MEFGWSEQDAAFRQELRDFLARELPDRWWSLVPGEEPASDFTFAFCRKLGEAGLLAPHWPSEYGGRDASGWQFIILGEELWRAGEPRGAQYMNVNWIGPAIMSAGTEEQKAYHLRRITAGDVIWCQGFSEPAAGTDLASLTLGARREGD
jgi:alkylation response protein AidB-like acyl-CoA dehydrogenase